MKIRTTTVDDRSVILRIHREAFGAQQGDEVSQLTGDLLSDPSAEPILSLLAFSNDEASGHILFSKSEISGSDQQIKSAILAPLAVLPEFQRSGVGGRLIRDGLERLAESGVQLVFVLGHPSYYPSHGFVPACPLGFEAPFQPPGESIDAWMVQALAPGIIGTVQGRVLCADALNELRHWRE